MSASYVARFIPLERLPLLAPASLARFRDLDAGLPFWSPSGSPWSSWVIPWAPLGWHISSHACANVSVAPSSDPALTVVTLSASRACRSGQVARLDLYGCLHVRGLAPCRPRPWLWCRCVAARVAGFVARGCPGCLVRVLRSPIFQLYAVLVRPLGAHSARLKGLRVWVASWLPFVSRVLVDST